MEKASDQKRYLTEPQAGTFLGYSTAAMRDRRRKRRRPSYYQIGRRILYQVQDLEAFLASKRVEVQA